MLISLSETLEKCENLLENPYMYYWIFDGLMYVKYKPDTIVDLKAAKMGLKDRLTLCNGKPYAVINECKGVKYWTKEARVFQNTPENYKLYKAGAIIYSDNFVATTIVNFYLKFTKVLIPAKFFTKESEAFEWIQKYK